MKQKIKSALDKAYRVKLGLSEEAIERAATLGATFITSDEQIESFVISAEAMLKAEQSAADKIRTEYSAKLKGLETEKAELEAKLKDGNKKPEPEPEPKDTPDIAAIVAQAVAVAINPLQEKLTAFETAQSQKSAVAALDELKATWDYAKGFPAESDDAYERVMELYEVGGKKWTAEELTAKYKEKFGKAVSKKGVTDLSQPFKGDGSKSQEESDKAFAEEIRNALGLNKGE